LCVAVSRTWGAAVREADIGSRKGRAAHARKVNASSGVRRRNVLVLLRGQLWLLPLAISLAGLALACFVLAYGEAGSTLFLPQGSIPWWLFSGDAGTARDLLSSLLSGLMTMMSLVVSVTFVILSLAANQLGPRLIPTFMADRQIQAVIGLFLGTILYILVVLRSISDVLGPSGVPHVAVTGGTLLTVFCLFALLFYVHKVARSLVADSIVDTVGRALLRSVLTILPEPEENYEHGARQEHLLAVGQEIAIGRSGIIQVVEHDALLSEATDAGVILDVRVRAGHFVLRHGRHVLVRGGTLDDEAQEKVRQAFVIGPERSPAQDIEFGMRQLVEIGLRALSPGINDPFTAIATLNRLGEALEAAIARGETAGVLRDREGRPRVFLSRSDPEGMIGTAFDALRQAAGNNPAVLIRMADIIGELARGARGDRWNDGLAEQLGKIGETAQAAQLAPADLSVVRVRLGQAANALGQSVTDLNTT
jgi:uncharacterized membrane protein